MLRTLSLVLIGLSVVVGSASEAGPVLGADTYELPAKLAAHARPPAEFQNDLGTYRSPLLFDDGSEVKTAEDWRRRRAEIRAAWIRRLGTELKPIAKPQVKYLQTERRENFTEHHVHVEVGPEGRMADGYLLVPDGTGPFPAVFVPFYEPLTSIGRGKPESVGTYDFGIRLTRLGFVTLSIGTPGSIEHPGEDTRALLVRAGDELKIQPLGYLAHVAVNCNTALGQMKNVDPTRIGMVGHSYGGKWTLFGSCLDERFAAACWCDPGIVFDETNRNINYWEPWYLGWAEGPKRKPGVPTAENGRTGLYKTLYERDSREMLELESLAAPRPILISGGSEDRPHHWRAVNHLIAVNRVLGRENRVLMTNRPGHTPTPEAVEVIDAFFVHHLGGK
jgi:dienelactone hydrolase